MITRSIGIVASGYIVGGGYEGITKELDNIILNEAELLQDSFNTDVEIRYNSHRKSGGAWIKDNNYSCKIGLCARLAKSKYLTMTTEERINTPFSEIDKYPDDIIIIYTFISKEFLNDKQEGEYKEHDTIKNGIEWILKSINKEKLSEYLLFKLKYIEK